MKGLKTGGLIQEALFIEHIPSAPPERVPLTRSSFSLAWNATYDILVVPTKPATMLYKAISTANHRTVKELQNSATFLFAWSPDETILAVTDYDNNELMFFDTRGTLVYSLPTAAQVRSMAWNYDGASIAVGLSNDTVEVWAVH